MEAPGAPAALPTPPAPDVTSDFFVALLTSFDVLLMRAATGARAMFTGALFSLRPSGIFMALLPSLNVLFMRAAPSSGAMLTCALFGMGATSTFVALLASFAVLVMVTALVSHFTIPFF